MGCFGFRCTKKLHEQDCSAGGGRRPEADGEWLKGVWGRVGLPRAGRREAKILIFYDVFLTKNCVYHTINWLSGCQLGVASVQEVQAKAGLGGVGCLSISQQKRS